MGNGMIQNNRGYTLLELMLTMALLTVIVGALFILAESLGRASNEQESIITTQGQATTAMMQVSRDLRSAASSSIAWNADNRMTSLTYQVATDVDGNGTAVDAGGSLELGPQRTLQRDVGDLNNDGRTDQLVLVVGGAVQSVLANNLMFDEDANDDNALQAAEDSNFNNRLDRGLLFENTAAGIQITVQCQHQTSPQSNPMISTMVETISPRN